MQFIFKLSVSLHKDYMLNRLRYWVSADTEINVHLHVMLWKTSLKDAPASSKELLDIQAIIECGFTLKGVRNMIRTYSIEHTLQLCKIKSELRFCALPMDTNFWWGLKVFNLVRLLEKETLKMFSMRQRHTSKINLVVVKFAKLRR